MKKILGGLTILTLVTCSYGLTPPGTYVLDLALGQLNLTSSGLVFPATAGTLNKPRGVVVDAASRKVFVADTENNRVLRYASATALNTGASAEAVFGQGTFSNANLNQPTAILGLQKPSAIFFDHLGRLWVTDTYNHRVLMFNNALTSGNQPMPSKVLGQADLSITTKPTAAAANKLLFPSGVWVEANDRLWVVDGFNRVLRFNAVTSKTNGADADGVLGQPDFITSTARSTDARTIKTFTVGGDEQSSLVVSSTGDLFVASFRENRVLRFNNAGALANNAAANSVLGQPSFTASMNSSAVNTRSINGDDGFNLTIAPENKLWVSGTSLNYVIPFEMTSTEAIDFTPGNILGGNIYLDGLMLRKDNKDSFNGKRSFYFDSVGSLWVADAMNNRVVRLSAPASVVERVKPVLALGKFVKSTKAAKVTLKGSASDASGIKEVKYRIGRGPLKTATGTKKWSFKANLVKGMNRIVIVATDANGNVSLEKVVNIKRR